MAEYIRVNEERLKELKKQFGFLDGLIAEITEGITGIKVKSKSEMPTGTALKHHSDSGYEYWTNIRTFSNVTVHEYWTKDSKDAKDVKLAIYVEPGSKALKNKRM